MTQVDSAALDVLEGDQAEVAATFKGGAAQTIGDYNNAFMQLDSGMIDAVACDLSIAQYQIAANPDKYVQLSTPLSTEHYAVGFKKGDTELAQEGHLRPSSSSTPTAPSSELCEKYASYGHQLRQLGARQVMPPLAPGKQLDRVSYWAGDANPCPMYDAARIQRRSCAWRAGEASPAFRLLSRQPVKVGIRRVKTRAFLLEGDQWNSEP